MTMTNGGLDIVRVCEAPYEPMEDGVYRQSRVFFWPLGPQPEPSIKAMRLALVDVYSIIELWRMDKVWKEGRDWFPDHGSLYPSNKYSTKAACKCGCSPCFVLSARLGLDIHVWYEFGVIR